MSVGETAAQRSRIHVIGNTVVDILVRDVPPAMDRPMDGWSRSNVDFLAGPPECVLGGNGGSMAYALGRLGNEVSLNTRIGADSFGELAGGWLRDAGVRLTGPGCPHTAVNTILLHGDGARRSLYYTAAKVDWRRNPAARPGEWVYASGYGQVGSEDLQDLIDVFEETRLAGSKVAFDPGPWFFVSSSPEQMRRAWDQTDCLLGTEAELGTWRSRTDIGVLIEDILDEGPEQVAVKRGEKGAAFGSRGGSPSALPAEQVPDANTVGAGDTFNAGVIHKLNGNSGLEEAVGFGLELAGRAVRSGRGVMGAFEEPESL